MCTMKFDMKKRNEFNWEYLLRISRDFNYFNNNYKVSVLKTTYKEVAKIRLSKNYGSKLFGKISGSEKDDIEIHKQIEKYLKFREYVETLLAERRDSIGLTKGFLYSLKDFFENKQFKMIFVKPPNEEEIILRKKYAELLRRRTNFMQKSDIIKLKKVRRDLKMKIKDIEKRQYDKKHYQDKIQMVLLSSNLFENKSFKIKNDLSIKEINIAKICILNNLKYPPNYYNLNEMKIDDNSQTNSVNTGFHRNFETNLNKYIKKSLSDFSNLENVILPKFRGNGQWIDFSDLNNYFDFVFVHFNPNIFPYVDFINGTPTPENTCIDPEKEILVLYKDPKGESSSNFYVNFKTNSTKKKNHVILQKFDFVNFQTIKNYESLNVTNESLKISVENENKVYRFSLFSQDNYKISIYSERRFKLISISEYLTSLESWNKKEFKFSTGEITKNFSKTFFKLKINAEISQRIIIQTKSPKFLCNFIEYKIIDLNKVKKNNEFEYLNYDDNIKNLQIEDFESLEICEGNHVLLLSMVSPYNLKNESLEINIFHRFDLEFELLPITQNLVFSRLSEFNKYNYITKNNFFFKPQKISFTLSLQLKYLKEDENSSNNKNTKKGVKSELNFENLEDFKKGIYINLKILKNNKEIYQNFGIDSCNIYHIEIQKDNNDDEIYFEASFDERYLKNYEKEEFFKNLIWILNINSTDTISIAKNTEREDKNNYLIKSWGLSDLSRKEKANVIRERNILLLKNEKEISAQELNKLNELENKIKSWKDKNNNSNNVKDKNKKKKNKDKDKQIVNENLLVVKDWENLKSEECFNKSLKNIKEIFERERFIIKNELVPNYYITEEDKNIFKENSVFNKEQNLTFFDNLNSFFKDEIENVDLEKDLNTEEKLEEEKRIKKLNEDFLEIRKVLKNYLNQKKENSNFWNKMENYSENIDYLKNFQQKSEKESSQFLNERLKHIIFLIMRNIKLKEFQEKIKLALEMLEIKVLEPCLKQKKEENIILNDALEINIKDLIENIEKNPKYIEEAIAEMKKNKKKGKK